MPSRAFPPRRGAPRRGPRPAAGARDPQARLAANVERSAKPGLGKQAGELVQRAVDKLAKGDARAALDPATRARALAPRAPAAREVLGMALYDLGEYRDALRELQAYKRISGRSDQNHLIADSHRALGAPEKAVPLAEEAVRAPIPAENRAEAAVVGAAALADLGRFTEALALLRRYRVDESRGLRPWDLRVRYVQADVLERSGRRDEAREAFESILRHDADAFDVLERLERLGGGRATAGSQVARTARDKPGETRAPTRGRTPAGSEGANSGARGKAAARRGATGRKPAPRRTPPRGGAGGAGRSARGSGSRSGGARGQAVPVRGGGLRKKAPGRKPPRRASGGSA